MMRTMVESISRYCAKPPHTPAILASFLVLTNWPFLFFLFIFKLWKSFSTLNTKQTFFWVLRPAIFTSFHNTIIFITTFVAKFYARNDLAATLITKFRSWSNNLRLFFSFTSICLISHLNRFVSILFQRKTK